MARYTINCKCGHQREVELFGKYDDRQKKISWYENQLCPECWGKKQREEEAKKPITMTINCNGLLEGGRLMLEVRLSGGTINRKDEIKEMGYKWSEEQGGIINMITCTRPTMGWGKLIPISDQEEAEKTLQQLNIEAKNLDAQIENGIDMPSLLLMAKSVATQSAPSDVQTAEM
jgi:hypothetical protein